MFKNRKKKRYKIHRLVAITFIPNIDNKPEVNHIDGNKENNCISNLEWTTSSENMQHAFKMGLAKVNKNMKGRFGTDNPNSKPVNQYTLDNVFIKSWESTKDIERELKIHHSHISKCCKGKLKTAGAMFGNMKGGMTYWCPSINNRKIRKWKKYKLKKF